MSGLAKKSPDGATNAFKIKLVNATLEQCNSLLGDTHRPFKEFKTFNPDELPSNSDVTFILSQYIECAEKFRSDNIMHDGVWYWRIAGEKKPTLRTVMPKKFQLK